MKQAITLGLSGLLALSCQTAWSAPSETTRTLDDVRYLFVSGRYIGTDSDRGTDRGTGFQAGFAIPLRPKWGLEINGFSQTYETGSTAGSDFYHRGGGVDLVYTPGNRSGFTPFVLAGLGVAQNDVVPNANDKVTAYGNLGIGLVGGLFGSDWLRGRGEARVVYDDYLGGKLDYVLSAGIEVGVGQTRERTIREEVKVKVPVEKVVIREVPVEKIVYRDRIAETPAPVERIVEKPVERVVIQTVAPKDSDGDNIPDDKDRCPGTPAGLTTDNFGCVIQKQVLRLENVHFEYDSDVLTASSQPALDRIAEFLKADAQVSVLVAGHTDDRGADSYNQKLSQRRANSVRAALINRQIDAARLDARGYGESQPVADNTSDAGRASNRRVELRIK